MKLSARLFGCLLFFVVAKATGQVSALKGTWINPEMQAMVINGKPVTCVN